MALITRRPLRAACATSQSLNARSTGVVVVSTPRRSGTRTAPLAVVQPRHTSASSWPAAVVRAHLNSWVDPRQ